MTYQIEQVPSNMPQHARKRGPQQLHQTAAPPLVAAVILDVIDPVDGRVPDVHGELLVAVRHVVEVQRQQRAHAAVADANVVEALHDAQLLAQHLEQRDHIDHVQIEEQPVDEERRVGRLDVQRRREHFLIQLHLLLHLLADDRPHQGLGLHGEILRDVRQHLQRFLLG